MTSLGVFVGNNPGDAEQFESWLGRDVDFVSGHTNGSSWSAVEGSLRWIDSQFDRIDVPVYWTVPMLVGNGTLARGADGAYNGDYRSVAQQLVSASGDEDKIHVRVGHEFNGDWFDWGAKGREADYIQTYRQFVNTFESVSGKFVFEWTVNAGDMGMDPAKAYPGSQYVDVIGMDFYYNTTWYPKDPAEAWKFMVNREYGLQWLEDFADNQGKPTAYSEWGVNSNAAVYIEQAAQWFKDHDVAYQSYWNSNADFPGKLSSGQYSGSGYAFKEAFSQEPAEPDNQPQQNVASPGFDADGPAVTGAWQTWIGGSSGNDRLVGDQRNNKIDGGGGNDTMIGSTGSDQYTVDRSSDVVQENVGAGIDVVHSYSKSYTLSNNVENLDLLGNYGQTGIGNGLDNRIKGGSGADLIDGQQGDDFLTGAGNRDVFRFDRGDGQDVVTDFAVSGGGADQLDLRSYDFSSYGNVAALMTDRGSDLEIDLPGAGGILLLDVQANELDGSSILI